MYVRNLLGHSFDRWGVDHLARSYMSGIERGVRNVSVLTVAKIAKALKVPLTTLFERLWSHRRTGQRPSCRGPSTSAGPLGRDGHRL